MKELEANDEANRVHEAARERHIAALENENSSLKTQLKRKTAERDHFFRAFSALSAQLDGFAGGMITAIHMARTQAYGEKRPQIGAEAKPLTQLRRTRNDEDDGADAPAFLMQGPAADDHRRVPANAIDQSPSPVNLDALRRAFDGR
jgi:hypothetical protein